MTTPAPLRGLTVIDLTRHLPGPLAARLLADLGARVIKVEEPRAGDPVRAAPPLLGGQSPLGTLLLAGVESVALDLKQPAALEVVAGLLARADVLLESFRPGTLERLGLAPAALRQRFPRLIICSLTGWGQEGPFAGKAGHDLTYQAIAGALAPTAAVPAVPVADVVGAWSAVAAVLAALYGRERDGGGTWVDQALLDAAVHANVAGWAAEAGNPKEVGEPLPLTGALPCYGLYRTKDGALLAVAALEPHFWRRLCDAADRRDLRGAQYASGRRARKKVARLIGSRTRAAWLALLADRDVPVEPVLAAGEALAHPQVAVREVLRRGADGLPRLGFPARLDGGRPRAGERVPELGEDTLQVIAEHGLAGGRSARELRAAGIGRRPGGVRGWLARMLMRRG
ncbi:MAG TPA: CaiB/BaiF CoA-transferase family protein [Thermoanaerobaculia bacterium]|nr:CaiB/BaiF CoA-transferase family protein [Thermoanaerobaculia bacterium]